jgi:hypothetical protein
MIGSSIGRPSGSGGEASDGSGAIPDRVESGVASSTSVTDAEAGVGLVFWGALKTRLSRLTVNPPLVFQALPPETKGDSSDVIGTNPYRASVFLAFIRNIFFF